MEDKAQKFMMKNARTQIGWNKQFSVQESENNECAYSLPLINGNNQKDHVQMKNKASFGRNTFYIPKQQGLLEIFPVGDAEGSSVIAG